MSKRQQIPPVLLARAVGLLIRGRIHFARNGIGELVREKEEDFVVFRKIVLHPSGSQPETPEAVFRVRFRFAKFSARVNRILSVIPIPFIVAQPGFRSKTWMLGQKTGVFQGVYEWDSVEDAEDYWTSFPMTLMKSRAIPGTLFYEISATAEDPRMGLGGEDRSDS